MQMPFIQMLMEGDETEHVRFVRPRRPTHRRVCNGGFRNLHNKPSDEQLLVIHPSIAMRLWIGSGGT